MSCDAAGASPFCAECALDAPEPLVGELEGVPLIAAGLYRGPLANAIRRFKFDPRPELARPLAALLTVAVQSVAASPSAVWVPVPLHYARLCERGFNQSALLAGALARMSRRKCAARLLSRSRETAQQAQLDKRAREHNAQGAFSVRGRTDAEILLVDDVVTTGATVSACIGALRQKGVKVRAVFTLARTPPL